MLRHETTSYSNDWKLIKNLLLLSAINLKANPIYLQHVIVNVSHLEYFIYIRSLWWWIPQWRTLSATPRRRPNSRPSRRFPPTSRTCFGSGTKRGSSGRWPSMSCHGDARYCSKSDQFTVTSYIFLCYIGVYISQLEIHDA